MGPNVLIHRTTDLKKKERKGCLAKLADFGMSRKQDQNLTMSCVGTPLFAAPELLCGVKYDEKVDVYAFGIMLNQMLDLQTPYDDGDPLRLSDVVDPAISRRPKIQKWVPSWLKYIIEACWSFYPSARPTAKQVRRMLKKQAWMPSASPFLMAEDNPDDVKIIKDDTAQEVEAEDILTGHKDIKRAFDILLESLRKTDPEHLRSDPIQRRIDLLREIVDRKEAAEKLEKTLPDETVNTD